MFEHRELRNDKAFVAIAVDQILASSDLIAQRSECGSNDRFLSGDDQNHIAFFSACNGSKFGDLCFAQCLEK
jgi:hypothetical protein